MDSLFDFSTLVLIKTISQVKVQSYNVQKRERKKTLWPLFCGWGSTASKLQPLRGGRLLFTIQFPEIPSTHFIDLGRMTG